MLNFKCGVFDEEVFDDNFILKRIPTSTLFPHICSVIDQVKLAKGASKDGHGGKTGRPGTQATAQLTQFQAPRHPSQCLGAHATRSHHTGNILAPRCPNSTTLAPRRPSNIFMHQAAAPSAKHLVRIPCSGA
ncbi:hypothetical protein PIB30_047094 [Stylosanthes scabra]|uniref:Uncharacterized protein n=1 Tax=Stylosanthes scabra TaxID=79078 RepID=A0ABU6YH42_9FABA|nr:hypothetical protein [Stylosanthes scabra]